ncbi:hypothetical protein [Mesorhizobium sp.]|uniref:hypothetical protein n=1 Tax=Mesorhizobium sp. TaxID=1871066 RepID=UPI0025F7ED89|nr:hypothetical protein [Mesorhizobium sp.]
MTTDRRKLIILAAWLAGAVFLSHRFGDAIYAAGGEGLTVGAGLAYFGLLAFVIDKWA